jgi:sugar phosphate permease
MMGAVSCKGWLTDHWKGWPWIFFIEGAMTVCFGILALFFMPHAPSQASFLTPYEKEVALRRMKEDSHGAEPEEVDKEHFNWHWVRIAILNLNTWICSLAWFFLLVPLYVRFPIFCWI